MKTMDSFLWSGNSKLVVDGKKWLGLKGDSTVVSSTLSTDLVALASTPENIRAEVAEKRDELYITNKCVNPLRLAVSSEIMSNWERPFSGSDFGFGTALCIRGDDKRTADKIAFYMANGFDVGRYRD